MWNNVENPMVVGLGTALDEMYGGVDQEQEHADMVCAFVTEFAAGNSGRLRTPAWSSQGPTSTIREIVECICVGNVVDAMLNAIRAGLLSKEPAVHLAAKAAVACMAKAYADDHAGYESVSDELEG